VRSLVANVAETLMASGGPTPGDKTEREARSIERVTGQHCEAVLGAPIAVDPYSISTYLGPRHVPAAVDADRGLIQNHKVAVIHNEGRKGATQGGQECSLRARVRRSAAPDMGSPRRETQAVHQAAHGR
jgi:hypothetical protein